MSYETDTDALVEDAEEFNKEVEKRVEYIKAWKNVEESY